MYHEKQFLDLLKIISNMIQELKRKHLVCQMCIFKNDSIGLSNILEKLRHFGKMFTSVTNLNNMRRNLANF